jgi:hypothetical protein
MTTRQALQTLLRAFPRQVQAHFIRTFCPGKKKLNARWPLGSSKEQKSALLRNVAAQRDAHYLIQRKPPSWAHRTL